MLKSKKAQITIIGLLFTLIAVVVFVATYPILKVVIQEVTNTSGNVTLNYLLDFIPIAMVLTILISIFMYTQPQRE